MGVVSNVLRLLVHLVLFNVVILLVNQLEILERLDQLATHGVVREGDLRLLYIGRRDRNARLLFLIPVDWLLLRLHRRLG